jgi:hypothetical protein
VPETLEFANHNTYSQLVVSESAAGCILNNLAVSPIGRLILDENRINQLFKKSGMKFNTNSLATYLPIFQQKLGENVPMGLHLRFKNINVMFGKFDSDVILEYTACV